MPSNHNKTYRDRSSKQWELGKNIITILYINTFPQNLYLNNKHIYLALYT